MKPREHTAWAIDTRSHEGHGMIGKYWWFEGEPPKVPTHMRGAQGALFENRKDARAGLATVKGSFPRARVIRVKITIEEVTNETTKRD